MVQIPKCRPLVCLTPYADFIITLVGGLLLRNQEDGRMELTSTVILMKPWRSTNYVLSKYILQREDKSF